MLRGKFIVLKLHIRKKASNQLSKLSPQETRKKQNNPNASMKKELMKTIKETNKTKKQISNREKSKKKRNKTNWGLLKE